MAAVGESAQARLVRTYDRLLMAQTAEARFLSAASRRSPTVPLRGDMTAPAAVRASQTPIVSTILGR